MGAQTDGNLDYFLQFSGWSVFLKGNWDTATFVTNYLPLMLFPVLYIIGKVWKRCSLVKPEEMDFKSGLAEVMAASCVLFLRCVLLSLAYAWLADTTSHHPGISWSVCGDGW